MTDPDFDEIVARLQNGDLSFDERNRLLWRAIATYDPDEPAQLAAMLQSPDPTIIGDALFILYELGGRGYSVVDQAIEHLHPADYSNRLSVLNGLVGAGDRLSASQIAKCLPVVADENVVIRKYMALLLADVDTGVLSQAIEMLDGPVRDVHRLELGFLTGARSALSALASDGEAVSCYAAAHLIGAELTPTDEQALAGLASTNETAAELARLRLHRARLARYKARKALRGSES